MVSVDYSKRAEEDFSAFVDIKKGQEAFNSYLPAPYLASMGPAQRKSLLRR